jgi:ketosteroid isomerase-like protein
MNESSAIEVARRYHETWNDRDADALTACFTEDGIFCNPDTYPGINGEALAAHVKTVWAAVPDLHLELLDAGEIKPNLVAHHWALTGTVAVPDPDGGEPTGRPISFKGASFVKVDGNKIVSDYVYFDRKRIDEQLAAN